MRPAQLPIQWYKGLFPRMTPYIHSPYVNQKWCLIRQRNNFTFYFSFSSYTYIFWYLILLIYYFLVPWPSSRRPKILYSSDKILIYFLYPFKDQYPFSYYLKLWILFQMSCHIPIANISQRGKLRNDWTHTLLVVRKKWQTMIRTLKAEAVRE